jgi:predicted RNase H-like HicB family nuclease
MTRTYTAYIEYDSDTESYVGTVPGLPGAHSQGKSLDELQTNLREVVQLVLEERKARGEPIDADPFVGLQQVIVRV